MPVVLSVICLRISTVRPVLMNAAGVLRNAVIWPKWASVVFNKTVALGKRFFYNEHVCLFSILFPDAIMQLGTGCPHIELHVRDILVRLNEFEEVTGIILPLTGPSIQHDLQKITCL
jgi:hypothetical protein